MAAIDVDKLQNNDELNLRINSCTEKNTVISVSKLIFVD